MPKTLDSRDYDYSKILWRIQKEQDKRFSPKKFRQSLDGSKLADSAE